MTANVKTLRWFGFEVRPTSGNNYLKRDYKVIKNIFKESGSKPKLNSDLKLKFKQSSPAVLRRFCLMLI